MMGAGDHVDKANADRVDADRLDGDVDSLS